MSLVSVIKRQIQFIVLTVFVPFQLSKKWFQRETGTGTAEVSLYRTLSNLDQETKIELKDHLLMRKVVRLASQTIEFIQVGILFVESSFQFGNPPWNLVCRHIQLSPFDADGIKFQVRSSAGGRRKTRPFCHCFVISGSSRRTNFAYKQKLIYGEKRKANIFKNCTCQQVKEAKNFGDKLYFSSQNWVVI